MEPMKPRHRIDLTDFSQVEQDNLRHLVETARTHLRRGAALADGNTFVVTTMDGNTAMQLTIEAPAALFDPYAWELLVGNGHSVGEGSDSEIQLDRIDYLLAGAFHLTHEHITVFMMRTPFDYEEPEMRLDLRQFAQGLLMIGLAVTQIAFDGLIEPPQASGTFSGAQHLNLVTRYV